MTKYHQLEDGSLAICRATKKPCPKGSVLHVEAGSLEEAQRKIEELNDNNKASYQENKYIRLSGEDYAKSLEANIYYDALGVFIIPTEKTLKHLTEEESNYILNNKDEDPYIVSFDCPSTWVDGYIESYADDYDLDVLDVNLYNNIEKDYSRYKEYISNWVDADAGIYNEEYKRLIHIGL